VYYKTVGTVVGDTSDWILEDIGEVGYASALAAGLVIRRWEDAFEVADINAQMGKLRTALNRGISDAELNAYISKHEVFAVSEIFYRAGQLPFGLKSYNYEDKVIVDAPIDDNTFVLVVDKVRGYKSLPIRGRHRDYPWAGGAFLMRWLGSQGYSVTGLSSDIVYGTFYDGSFLRCVSSEDLSIIKFKL